MSGVEDSKFLLSKIVSSRSVVVLRFVEFNFIVSRDVEIRVEVSGNRMEVSGIRVKASWDLMSRVEDSGLLLKIVFSRSVVVPRFVEFTLAVSRDVEIRLEVSGIGIQFSGIGVEVYWNLTLRVEESKNLKMMLSRLLAMGDVGFDFVVSRGKETGIEVSVSGFGESEIRMC